MNTDSLNYNNGIENIQYDRKNRKIRIILIRII